MHSNLIDQTEGRAREQQLSCVFRGERLPHQTRRRLPVTGINQTDENDVSNTHNKGFLHLS
jgi:hypothetical protein